MLTPPYRRPFPNPSDVRDPNKLWQIIRELYEYQNGFQQVVEELRKTSLQNVQAVSKAASNSLDDVMAQSSLIGTSTAINPAQKALIPVVAALPPVNTATEGEAVQLRATGVIYVFQPGNPGSWVAATTTASAHQASHQAAGADAITGLLTANAKVQTRISGADVALRRAINFLPGSGILLSGADDAGNEESEITVTVDGDWITPAYAAGDFTADAGNWTVDAGDVQTYSYVILGKTMIVAFDIRNTDVSAAANYLQIAIPAGKQAVKSTLNMCLASDAGGAIEAGFCQVAAAGVIIFIKRVAGAWTITAADNTNVYGEIAFEIG